MFAQGEGSSPSLSASSSKSLHVAMMFSLILQYNFICQIGLDKKINLKRRKESNEDLFWINKELLQDSRRMWKKLKKEFEAKAKAEEERLQKARWKEGSCGWSWNLRHKAAQEAEKTYLELRNAFIKDYGYYHCTYSTIEEAPSFDELFDFFKFF